MESESEQNLGLCNFREWVTFQQQKVKNSNCKKKFLLWKVKVSKTDKGEHGGGGGNEELGGLEKSWLAVSNAT